MMFDYYYDQVPIEMRCLAPWQGNKHANEIWGIYYYLFHQNTLGCPLTSYEIRSHFKIKKYKTFRRLIKPLICCGFVSQKTNMQDICDNKNMWKYEITGLGIEYMKRMVHLICGVDI